MTNLSRVEDILKEGPDYSGPLLSRVEKLLYELCLNQGKIGFKGPYDDVEEMPIPGIEGYIYLVSVDDTEDYYDEYYWDDEHEIYNHMGTSKIEITVDNELSTTSENPVQNKVITSALNQVIANVNAEIAARQAADLEINTNLAAKQPKTLDTPIVVDGTAQTTVEGALNAINDKSVSITVDDAMSDQSANPVQNKVITNALAGKVNTVTGKGLSTNDYDNIEKAKVDAAQTKTLVTPITVDGVTQTTVEGALGAINGKTIDVDNALSSVSENPVQNKVVKGALDEKQDYVGLSVVNGRICVTYEEE